MEKKIQNWESFNEGVKITLEEKEMFDYLNDLRQDGATNMFGASSYLMDEFALDKYSASKVLSKWMENFNEDGYDDLEIDDSTKIIFRG